MQLQPKGAVKVLRYLWSIPAVRSAAGWLIGQAIEVAIKLIKKSRDGKEKDQG